MSTGDVNLIVTPERFVRTKERDDEQYGANLAALRTAIVEGDASGIAKGNVFARVRKTLNLPTKPR